MGGRAGGRDTARAQGTWLERRSHRHVVERCVANFPVVLAKSTPEVDEGNVSSLPQPHMADRQALAGPARDETASDGLPCPTVGHSALRAARILPVRYVMNHNCRTEGGPGAMCAH